MQFSFHFGRNSCFRRAHFAFGCSGFGSASARARAAAAARRKAAENLGSMLLLVKCVFLLPLLLLSL